MTHEVVTATPDTPLKEVVQALVASGISGVPVLADNELVGVVSEADLLPHEARVTATPFDRRSRRAARRDSDKAAGTTAGEVMTPTPITVGPDRSVVEAAQLMLEHRVMRLPVVDQGALVGIITRRDVLRGLARPDADIAAEVVRTLRDVGQVPEDIDLTGSVQDGIVTLRGSIHVPADRPVVRGAVRRIAGVVAVDDDNVVAREADLGQGHLVLGLDGLAH